MKESFSGKCPSPSELEFSSARLVQFYAILTRCRRMTGKSPWFTHGKNITDIHFINNVLPKPTQSMCQHCITRWAKPNKGSAKVRLNFYISVHVVERLTKSYSRATSHSLKKPSVWSSLQADINCTQAEPLCWTALCPTPLGIFWGTAFFFYFSLVVLVIQNVHFFFFPFQVPAILITASHRVTEVACLFDWI